MLLPAPFALLAFPRRASGLRTVLTVQCRLTEISVYASATSRTRRRRFRAARLRAFGRPLTASLGLLPVPPSPSRLLQDWYPAAYVDGVLVNHLVGKPGEPFWVQAYPSFIRWLKLAAGTPEPDLRQVAAFALDPDRLAAFVAQAEALGS